MKWKKAEKEPFASYFPFPFPAIFLINNLIQTMKKRENTTVNAYQQNDWILCKSLVHYIII